MSTVGARRGARPRRRCPSSDGGDGACSVDLRAAAVAPEETVASEPILRRLSEPELQTVEAADLYNASDYRRTIGGVSKSLGEPRASILPLAGVNQGS